MAREVPRTPPGGCPEHMSGTGVMPGVVEPLPLPIGKIATIDLEKPDGSFSANVDIIALTNYGPAWMLGIGGIIEGKRVIATFELCDCGCIVPLAFGPELTDGALQFAWSISNRHE